MLTKETIVAELIKYDSEHPKTLGEMADRRSVYAQRLNEMQFQSLVPEKISHTIGDGINQFYELSHPFGSRQIIVTAYDTETNEQILNMSMTQYKETIRVGFPHIVPANRIRVMIIG